MKKYGFSVNYEAAVYDVNGVLEAVKQEEYLCLLELEGLEVLKLKRYGKECNN